MPLVGRLVGCVAITLVVAMNAQAQPVPQPFPRTPPPAPRQPPPESAEAPESSAPPVPRTLPAPQIPARETPPSALTLGVPVYPGAQFIRSYDAGQGQRYYLYGATATFADLVQFYRTALKQRGEVVFEEPATHMFDTGRFREETMAFPPSVTIKDYTWGTLGGYVNPHRTAADTTAPARFPTIIQIVPAPGAATRN